MPRPKNRSWGNPKGLSSYHISYGKNGGRRKGEKVPTECSPRKTFTDWDDPRAVKRMLDEEVGWIP